jgi:hypothetical protein
MIIAEQTNPDWCYVRWLLAKIYLNYHNTFGMEDREILQ